jgi:hypothetical protein|uniref:Uncharacterized protein n=1 Tax=viral metagenome TaxID=1070528 RepID=A0A6C0IPG5_9ZZZZ
MYEQLYNIINNKYYIIRTGDFATNANKKILYLLFGVLLCIDDYYTSQSYDCLSIMIGSSVSWTIIELLLHASKTRVIKPMFISYSNRQIKLPIYIGVCLQGIQEGGVVSTFGLYFGDRLLMPNYTIIYHLFLIYMVINMSYKQTNNEILSKRQVNTKSSLLLIGSMTMYNGISMYNHPEHIPREILMCVSMLYMSSIWTVVSYYKGFRKVEVQEYKNNHYIIKPTRTVDVFYILGYDVVFEICIAYLTFYNWFVLHN